MATLEIPKPSGSGAEPPSGLYEACATAQTNMGFDAIDDTAIAAYREQGYLAVTGAFTAAEVEAAQAALTDLIARGMPPSGYIQFEPSVQEIVPTLSAEQRQDAVRKLMSFVAFAPPLAALAAHPRLIELVNRLLGAPAALFQDMALLKPPHLGSEKPWHQDHAYFDFPLGTPIVGVWIALDEATLDNGCMHLLSGGHRAGPRLHFQRRDWQICDTEMCGQRSVAVPLPPGGCLFFDGLLPHGTPPNRSPQRRRAVQFHYRPADAHPTTREERLAHFGSEGKHVSC